MNQSPIKTNFSRHIIGWLMKVPSIRSELIRLSTLRIFRHALATPISTINLSISLLEESSLTKVQFRYLNKINEAVNYIANLINQISFSDKQVKPSFFNLDLAISEIIKLYEDEFSIITQTSSYAKTQKCYVVGYKVLLQEALSCLLSNAIQAYLKDDLKKPILVTTHLQHHWARIDVIDFGRGMNKFQQKLAKLPGVSSKNHNRGWGLPFAKQVIEDQFKGKLNLTSFPNLGTRVSIFIPQRPAYLTKRF